MKRMKINEKEPGFDPFLKQTSSKYNNKKLYLKRCSLQISEEEVFYKK